MKNQQNHQLSNVILKYFTYYKIDHKGLFLKNLIIARTPTPTETAGFVSFLFFSVG